jgi:hypothetical protein
VEKNVRSITIEEYNVLVSQINKILELVKRQQLEIDQLRQDVLMLWSNQ